MGQVVKRISSHRTRYYWYPGDRKDWARGAIALIAGASAYGLLHIVTRSTLLPAVVGTSLATGIAGFNFGRRDSRALDRLADLAKLKYVRRAHTGRAVWRGISEGTGGAATAVIIVNLSASGFAADWLLPFAPAIVGALAHQLGMMYERLGTSESIDGPAKRATAPSSPAMPAIEPPGAAMPPSTTKSDRTFIG